MPDRYAHLHAGGRPDWARDLAAALRADLDQVDAALADVERDLRSVIARGGWLDDAERQLSSATLADCRRRRDRIMAHIAAVTGG